MIGQQWGHGEDKNTAAQLTAHAILGATLAYVNGGNPAAGGSAAVAAESAADYLSQKYKDNPDYQNANGEFEANRLPEDVKTQIRDLIAAIGAVVGGTVGDSAFNAQLAGVVGQNAVENNHSEIVKNSVHEDRVQAGRFQGCGAAGLAANSAACTTHLQTQTLNNLKTVGGLTLDFVPIVGDIKGFYEARTVGDYVFATIGLIPIAGDVAKDYYKAQKLYNEARDVGNVVKMKAALSDAAKACSGGSCFTAGTLIETNQGLKAIETFTGGELVWSRNDATLAYGYRPVIATKVTAEQAIFNVVIQDQQGRLETLETTSEHPFWIKDYGWLKASLLKSGMIVLNRDNEELTVVSQILIPGKLETVYNIEVAGFHTYHVGELGIWVHNANCCEIKKGQQISGGNPALKTDPYHPDNVQARIDEGNKFKAEWANSIGERITNQPIQLPNGRIVKVDVDLNPTIQRILNNQPNAALKDGVPYNNSTHPKLPTGPKYTEWVVPTEGVNGRGTQRIVVGSDNSMWYTPNHYGQVRPDPSKPISPSNKAIGNTWRKIK